MKRTVFLALPVIALAAGSANGSTSGRPAQAPLSCSLVASRNVQVTDVGAIGHRFVIEPVIAVNPADPRNIVVGGWSIGPGASQHDGLHLAAWTSDNRGSQWRSSRFTMPDGTQAATVHAGDAEVAFDRAGDVYFSGTVSPWRSLNRGGNFESISHALGFGETRDALHNVQFGADLSNGPYGGHLYMFSMSDNEAGSRRPVSDEFDVRLLTVEGTRILHDVTVATSQSIKSLVGYNGPQRDVRVGAYYSNTPVSAAGIIYIPVWTAAPGASNDNDLETRHWLVRSLDGGRTVTTLAEVKTAAGEALIGPSVGNFAPYFALDMGPRRGSDRMYVTWVEQVYAPGEPQAVFSPSPHGRWQLLFSSSIDGGRTWAPRRVLDDNLANPRNVMGSGYSYGGVKPTMPVVQVNNRGVVLLTYYRFRAGPPDARGNPSIFHQRMMTASLDGGATFLPERPLASAETDYRPSSFGTGTALDPGEEGNGDLGHYMKVVADRYGVFHAAWLDGRTGRQEIWYANIRVQCGGRQATARRP